MPRNNHINFSRSILAFIFLFLNGICVASPSVKNSTDNFTQTSSVQLGYDLNNPETTENHLPAQSIRQQSVRRSVVPANQADFENIYNNTAPLHIKEDFHYFRAGTYFHPIPGYYIFLFRYTLF